MIIVLNDTESQIDSTFAHAFAASIFPQNPIVNLGIPTEEPGFLGSMTIFTWEYPTDLPLWLLNRNDYTIINITRLREELPNNSKDIQVGGLNFSLFELKNNG